MSKPVLVVDAHNVENVSDSLAKALWENGPAVLIKDQHTHELLKESTPHLNNVPEETALIINTSGTSGTPKTVALSAEGLIAAANATHHRLGGPGQWLLSLPLTFIAGASILTRSLVAHTTPIVVPVEHFDPETFIEGVLKMTGDRKYASVVPVQLSRLLTACEHNTSARKALASLDAILVGGQALDEKLKSTAKEHGLNIVTTYGSSETSGGCVYDGIPLEGVEIEIDPVTSEIMISAPQLALGYIDEDQRTNNIFQYRNNRRRYHTGDRGEIRNGILEIWGRQDRTIISGGIKIDLDHMQSEIAQKMGLKDCAVVHIPDLEWGSRPVVVISQDEIENRENIHNELIEFVSSTLGKAAIPKSVVVVEKLPRTSSGKLDFVALSRLAMQQG